MNMKKFFLIISKNIMKKTIQRKTKIPNKKNKHINQWSQEILKRICKQNFQYFMKNLKTILYCNQKLLIF